MIGFGSWPKTRLATASGTAGQAILSVAPSGLEFVGDAEPGAVLRARFCRPVGAEEVFGAEEPLGDLEVVGGMKTCRVSGDQ
jgi:hypothetical protein